MKTVLIVEDEKMIRQGLKAMIQRSGVPVETILECNNGELALEIIKEQKIDVLFTDIRMPKMDGIELVKQMQSCEYVPLTVAISGYDDFSYAVEMLRNGVREYLLKPIERERIYTILQNLEEEIQVQIEREHISEKAGYQQLKYFMLSDQVTEEEVQILRKQYEEFFYQGSYVVCVAPVRKWGDEDIPCVCLRHLKGQDVFLIEENRIKDCAEELFSDYCVGASQPYQGIGSLRQAYVEAEQARKYAFCTAATGIVTTQRKETILEKLREEAEKLLDANNCQSRIQLIGTERQDELIRAWERFFTETKQGWIFPEEFEGVMKSFFEEAEKNYHNVIEEFSEELHSVQDIWEYDNIDTYQEACMEWILKLQAYISKQMDGSQNRQKMREAEIYIQEHYNEDINMAVVSNYLSINYSLFSWTFKQHTGRNFVNYLKDIRMEKAKELLAETDKKILEISKEVGYDNEKHFMKLFKSTFGISPSEYRKNIQNLSN